jgi:hypothetical protein
MESRLGNDYKYESWGDNNIFFPIATKLVTPLYKLGFTPNMVTIFSSICTLSTIYFLYTGEKFLAILVYLFGYTLDCVDGRMARKYSLTSDIGIALDPVSDNITNLILLVFILFNYTISSENITMIIIAISMTYLLGVSYGLTEALDSVNKTNCDNFYKRRSLQFNKYIKNIKNNDNSLLFSLYLFIIKNTYKIYKLNIPKYDENCINQKIVSYKEFGPGNYAILIAIFLLLL